MVYIRNHWRGDQPLLWSLWINLVLIRVVVLYADRYTLPPYIIERADAVLATVIFGVISHIVVYLWQITGLLRSCERQATGINSGVWVWISYIALITSLVFTLLSMFGAYQSLTEDKFRVDDPLALEHAREKQYSLSLNPDGSLIHIRGILALGMTGKLRLLLAQNPQVKGIVLQSEGGQVYEGRGTANLIKQHKLTTYVYGVCKSACATAFIGGARRVIGPDAKLGFHEYGLELRFPIPLFDLKGEQEKDISFYRQQKIAEEFLTRVFNSPHKDIWFPNHNELLEAGVIHHIVGK